MTINKKVVKTTTVASEFSVEEAQCLMHIAFYYKTYVHNDPGNKAVAVAKVIVNKFSSL